MTPGLLVPLLAGLGVPELLISVGILVLLFGASKLPELARGSGRALRIFKAETKGLLEDDDEDTTKTEAQRQIDAQNRAEATRRVEQVEQIEQVRPRDSDPSRPNSER